MIITKSIPFTKAEIKKLKEAFDSYIKTVIDLETKVIDFNSFINIRPNDNNTSNEIQDPEIRKIVEELTKYFFKDFYAK